ncbi:MAG: LptE family protein [Candidatus Omnitrophica bacterium]|nr:LptE family protein [Candidatus Omnitrophota bacterium]
MVKRLSFLVFLVFIFAVSSGCGYTAKSLLPPDLKTIYVDNFKNTIDVGKETTEMSKYELYRPGIENDVTNAIVNRFAFDGNLKIAQKEGADLILSGELTSYRKEALRYDNADNVEEYRVKITVDIKATRASDGKVLWVEKAFTGESTYNTTGNFVTTEEVARSEAMEDLARRVVERTIEGW